VQPSARVAPGGHIFVNTGLLKAVGRDDNMLAFVLVRLALLGVRLDTWTT
jgi:hypothetical protein